jgi:alpha/beta superfamily hydrolase
MIDGPAGRLEALLEEPEEGEPSHAALVCHPHPQHGGTMHNKVVYRIGRGLRHAGAVVLRFNYRGVNLSEGSYDRGIGELEDARAALTWLRARYPALPFSLAGFSFGSRIILRLGCPLRDVTTLYAIGFPTTYADKAFAESCDARKVFIHSTNDEHGPREPLLSFFDTLREPKKLCWVEARDHFFAGALEEFEETVYQAALEEFRTAQVRG